MIRTTSAIPSALFALALASPTPAAPGSGIPAHPRELKYQALDYPAPVRAEFRHELPGGVPAYVVEDHQLPLVDVIVIARGGSHLDPDGKEGLAELTATLMREGGAGDRDAAAHDEAVDFLAARISVSADSRETTARLNVLSKDLDAGLDLLFDALRRPRFQQDRMDLAVDRLRQWLGRRNDNSAGIEIREWLRLAYGADHFEAEDPTLASVGAISRQDLVDFHATLWHPGNLVIGVAGDVDEARALEALGRRLEGWSAGAALAAAPAPTHRPGKGVWIVDKPDVNQGRVSIGHLATTWDDPDAFALEIMNEVLGGGGFTSRITRRVRSDEGLAYSAGSVMGFGRDYPRTFRVAFQSRNEAVARAVDIVMEELETLRAAPITDEELDVAVNAFIETFPQRFSSAEERVEVFLQDEIWGRPADWWTNYRPRIRAVTKEDVLRVAKEYLHPDAASILVVGNAAQVLAGDPDHPSHALARHAGTEGVLEIALPDPATLAYPHPPRPVVAKTAAKE